jgi:uncharacterized protein (DUF1330 family)
MTVYAIAQLTITDRAAYDRYQAKFMGVMKHFQGRVVAADERPQVIEGHWKRDKVVLLHFRMRRRSASGWSRQSIRRFQKNGRPGPRPWCCW